MTLTIEEKQMIEKCIRVLIHKYITDASTIIPFITVQTYHEVIIDEDLLVKRLANEFINAIEEKIKILEDRYNNENLIKMYNEICTKRSLKYNRVIDLTNDDKLFLLDEKLVMKNDNEYEYITRTFGSQSYLKNFELTSKNGYSSMYSTFTYKLLRLDTQIKDLITRYNLSIE